MLVAGGVLKDGDADAFAAEEEPEDAEFPVLEGVEARVGMGIEVQQWTGGDKGFAAALAAGEEKRDIGDLFSDGVDGAIDPDDLLVRAGKVRRAGGWAVFATEPGEGLGGELGEGLLGGGGAAGDGDVEAEDVHRIFEF